MESKLNSIYSSVVTGIKEEWFNSKYFNREWFDYVVNLPEREKDVYLVVIFHNQVFNGGFEQYFINGYGQFAKETITILKQIGAHRKAELLIKALLLINNENLPDDKFRDLLLNKRLKSLFESDKLFDILEELDDVYYEMENNNIEEIESLLNYHIGN